MQRPAMRQPQPPPHTEEVPRAQELPGAQRLAVMQQQQATTVHQPSHMQQAPAMQRAPSAQLPHHWQPQRTPSEQWSVIDRASDSMRELSSARSPCRDFRSQLSSPAALLAHGAPGANRHASPVLQAPPTRTSCPGPSALLLDQQQQRRVADSLPPTPAGHAVSLATAPWEHPAPPQPQEQPQDKQRQSEQPHDEQPHDEQPQDEQPHVYQQPRSLQRQGQQLLRPAASVRRWDTPVFRLFCAERRRGSGEALWWYAPPAAAEGGGASGPLMSAVVGPLRSERIILLHAAGEVRCDHYVCGAEPGVPDGVAPLPEQFEMVGDLLASVAQGEHGGEYDLHTVEEIIGSARPT